MKEGLRAGRLVIPSSELQLTFSPSGGPGGQHANRSSTRAELAWNIDQSPVLNTRQRERLRRRLGNRLDSTGTLRVVADTERSQLRNRQEAARRLARLVARALEPEKPRVKTKPTRGATERRLQTKKRRADTKRLRRPPDQ
ncbi:alternative ribosome rescue aminoacyl-tRNA hydrolase ArfB [soil metagenome]